MFHLHSNLCKACITKMYTILQLSSSFGIGNVGESSEILVKFMENTSLYLSYNIVLNNIYWPKLNLILFSRYVFTYDSNFHFDYDIHGFDFVLGFRHSYFDSGIYQSVIPDHFHDCFIRYADPNEGTHPQLHLWYFVFSTVTILYNSDSYPHEYESRNRFSNEIPHFSNQKNKKKY